VGVVKQRSCRAHAGTAAAARAKRSNSARRAGSVERILIDARGDEQHAAPIEPRVAGGEPDERPRQQSGADDEHQRQGDLQDDAGMARAEAASAGGGASVHAQRLLRRDPADAQRRSYAGEERGGGADRDREGEDAAIEREVEVHRRRVGRQLRDEQRAAPSGDQHAERGAGCRQQQALGKQLPRDPPSRRAERQPHRQLVAARGRAGDQQVAMLAQAISSTRLTTARIVVSGRS
jgi:hypothetical protein